MKTKTKKIVWVAVLLVVLGGTAGYYYKSYWKNYFIKPCTVPLTYKVGSLDVRFGISQDKFKQAIAEAAQIWDKAAGRKLFEYQNSGLMPISLVYDNRQQATDQLKKLNLNLDTTEASYNQLKIAYERYESRYATAKQQYQTLQQQYTSQKQAYEAEVQKLNSRGRASAQEITALNAERDSINSLLVVLNQKSDALNQLASTINALVDNLNRIGKELNLDVTSYNTAGQNLGEFEEGVYSTDGFNKSIIIYEFNNYQMLVRVLAHELGHSLGLEHVTDPLAIMYKQNQSKNEIPTKSDIAELNRACDLK